MLCQYKQHNQDTTYENWVYFTTRPQKKLQSFALNRSNVVLLSWNCVYCNNILTPRNLPQCRNWRWDGDWLAMFCFYHSWKTKEPTWGGQKKKKIYHLSTHRHKAAKISCTYLVQSNFTMANAQQLTLQHLSFKIRNYWYMFLGATLFLRQQRAGVLVSWIIVLVAW